MEVIENWTREPFQKALIRTQPPDATRMFLYSAESQYFYTNIHNRFLISFYKRTRSPKEERLKGGYPLCHSTTTLWALGLCFYSFLITQAVGRILGREISPSQARYLHGTTQIQNKCRQTSIPRMGFEHTTPVFGREKTVHALDRGAPCHYRLQNNITLPRYFKKPQTFNYNSTCHINRFNLMHKLWNNVAQNKATFLNPVKFKKKTKTDILTFTARRQGGSVFAYKTLTKHYDCHIAITRFED
jgi:hypothetical protein